MMWACERIRVRCEKGKPVVRRGRKAYGPPRASWEEVAGPPNSAAELESSALSGGGATMPTEDQRSDRAHPGVPQGLLALALMPPLKILAPTVGVALVVWGLLFAYLSSPAWAETITVTTTTDEQTTNGTCSLREAIEAANTNTVVDACVAGSATENDVINFALPGTAPWTVNLSAALPNLSSNMDIEGPGADQFTVRRADTAAKA
jgi:CSLREA domain-containing protein